MRVLSLEELTLVSHSEFLRWQVVYTNPSLMPHNCNSSYKKGRGRKIICSRAAWATEQGSFPKQSREVRIQLSDEELGHIAWGPGFDGSHWDVNLYKEDYMHMPLCVELYAYIILCPDSLLYNLFAHLVYIVFL